QNDLMAGQVQMVFSDMPIALPQAKAGKLRALAVTGPERTPLVPGMPTVAESGLPGYVLVNWWGMFAPKGEAKEIVAKLARESVRIPRLPDIRDRCAPLGVEPASSTPAEFTAYIKS